jgi:pimeloyl-ACP methyl ester carboxylesterase
MNTQTQSAVVNLLPDLSIAMKTAGEGRVVLVLHGGGGPATVESMSGRLAQHARTLTPTHPGWNGTPRPEWLDGVDDLAQAYLDYLADHQLHDVVVVGSSVGGWIGAEMACRDRGGIISRLVLINAAGISVEGEAVRDVFSLTPRDLAEYSFYDPDRFFQDPATLPAEHLAMRRANMTALRVYAGEPYMHDPELLGRLGSVRIPTLVIWGEGDRITTLRYGQAYAAAFANARFETVARAGHLPHIEQGEVTLSLIESFIA